MKMNSIESLLNADPGNWSRALSKASGKKILIATNVGGFQHASLLESILAVALTQRGARVDIVRCDKALPACLKVEAHSMPDPTALLSGVDPKLCKMCCSIGDAHFSALGLTEHQFSNLITVADRQSAHAMTKGLSAEDLTLLKSFAGDQVGMHGHAGALRYFARGKLPETTEAVEVLRRFVQAAILTTFAFERLLDENDYDAAVFHHGIYVPQGPAGDVLRRRGVRVVNWNPSYRKSTFIFSHGDSYHFTLIDEPTTSWTEMPFTKADETEILDYLTSRASGTRDWIWFFEKPEFNSDDYVRSIGLDPRKPIVGMLTNVAWDAQLHFPTNAFSSIFDWVFATIDHFAKRPDLQLLIRIHPAEVRGAVPSKQLMMDEIHHRFSKLPENVFIIEPEDPISTYAVLRHCSAAIIYGTKMGVELSAIGLPVIVAGEAWVRNKGFTYDVESAAQYEQVLDQLPNLLPMTGAQIERARRYAYHFFFRRMIPLPFIEPSQSKIYAVDLETLEQLNPGNFPGLDLICDGIMDGAPFVYSAQELGVHA